MGGIVIFTVFALEKEKLTGIQKLALPFKRDKITENYIEIDDLEVRCIKYISYHEKINWDLVYTHAGYESKSLVCDENIHFPYGMGLMRYLNRAFYKRMAENFALCALMELEKPEKPRIAFYDVDGSEWEFVVKLCELTDNFIVVTANKEYYSQVFRMLLDELGVSLVMTNRLSRMKDCDLIIAPSRLTGKAELNSRAVVFTSAVPKYDLNGQCYYDYKISLPDKYSELSEIVDDEMYLGSALYTMGKQHILGGVIPTVAFNSFSTVTVKSIAKYLNNLA